MNPPRARMPRPMTPSAIIWRLGPDGLAGIGSTRSKSANGGGRIGRFVVVGGDAFTGGLGTTVASRSSVDGLEKMDGRSGRFGSMIGSLPGD